MAIQVSDDRSSPSYYWFFLFSSCATTFLPLFFIPYCFQTKISARGLGLGGPGLSSIRRGHGHSGSKSSRRELLTQAIQSDITSGMSVQYTRMESRTAGKASQNRKSTYIAWFQKRPKPMLIVNYALRK